MNPDDAPIFKALAAAGLYTPGAVDIPPGQLIPGPGAPAGDTGAARYASKALEYEADAVAASEPGTRNDNLNRAAFKLGSLVTAGHLDGQLVIDTLTAAARVSGLPPSEITRVVWRAARDGGQTPRVVKLEPRDTVAPAYTLTPAPPALTVVPTLADETPPDPPAPPSGTAPDLSHMVGDIDALYPPLDWPTVFDTTPDDVDWLAYPVIERGHLYSLYSPAKAGKSLVTLDICAALAAGASVLGQPPRPPITTLYVDLENSPADLVERLTDLGYAPGDLDRLRYLSFPALPPLDSPRGGVHLAAAAAHHKAELVVIDTVSRTIAGKENDADTFHALYRYAMAPLKAMGVTVIRLDHAGKDEDRGMRGSSAKISDVDTAWKLTRTGDTRLRLDRTASRNSHSPEHVTLDQYTDPLRHVVVADGPVNNHVAGLVNTLERLGIPQAWGRPKVRAALASAGIKARNGDLSEAIRIRRTTFNESA